MPSTPRRWMTLEERDAALRGAPPPPADRLPDAGGPQDLSEGPGGRRPRVEGGVGGASDDPWAFSRRGFLAAAGFTLAGAAAGCGRAPVQHAATPPTQPDELVPGQSTFYATTCGGCAAGCGLLVKCRDGRPIKVEGNPEHPLSLGGVCAVGQATVLSLYDSRRLLEPRMDGRATSWSAVDARVAEGLTRAREGGGAVRLVTGTVTSLSTQASIDAFLAAFPGSRHVATDALSASAILEAHRATHGVRALPRYRFEKASMLLAVEADPLGTWISPVEFTRGRGAARDVGAQPPRSCPHVQVESALTLTGSNADRRHRLEPGQVPAFVAHLAARLASKAGLAAPVPPDPQPLAAPAFERLVERLWAARGHALVVCGADDADVQALVNLANQALDAYGSTIDLAAPSFQRQGDDAALQALLAELEAGTVGALIVAGANPVADAPQGARFAKALAKVALTVALAEREDETTAACAVVLPLPHALEAWDDAEPVSGLLSLAQPTLRPLGTPRSLRECLAAWLGKPADDRTLVREVFAARAHPRWAGPAVAGAADAWNRAVHDGFARLAPRAVPPAAFDPAGVPKAAPRAEPVPAGKLALALVPSVAMLDGRHAHNPWLQELPDPITKQVWGNAALLAPATAARLGVEDGDLVTLAAEGAAITLPALRQPGLSESTVAVALGYGRRGTDRFAEVGPQWFESVRTVERGAAVGAAAGAFLGFVGGTARRTGRAVTLTKTGAHDEVARSQTYASLTLPANTAPKGGETRDLVRELTWSQATAARGPEDGGPKALSEGPVGHRPRVEGLGSGHGAPHDPESEVLWGREDAAAPGPRWGLTIDLAACTGCSACVVACQAENNVPVVGRDEVRRRRDLAWMRLDRYYADVEGAPGDVDVVHQPMLCHHCGNAPCETVCPVLATTHSSDGLNEQVYNRCVGTRYCANNCPFKVRRFNWFTYDRADPWEDLQLNPDVTVRTRGVMEKCSLCVQRIAEAKAVARVNGVALKDGDVRTACQQSCPAGAIVFGDRSDAKSAVSAAQRDARAYRLLDELHLRPAVGYLAKVRDGGPSEGGTHG